MSLRAALALAALCAATPLAAAEAADAPSAGQTPAPDASANTAPRRYSLHRDYGETPDARAFTRPQAAADQDLVLQPGFFEPLPPTLAAPPADPARDRQGRPVQQSAPDDAPQV